MISDKLYLEAEQNGITVICGAKLPLTKSVSVKDGEDMYIGIDDSAMETHADERTHLAHEIGHCMTGAFYSIRFARRLTTVVIVNASQIITQ